MKTIEAHVRVAFHVPDNYKASGDEIVQLDVENISLTDENGVNIPKASVFEYETMIVDS